MTCTLANVRDPRSAALSPAEKRQWKALQAAEGLDPDDDELSVQLVDVRSGGAPAYQLYLWSFGSAALFPAGKAKPIGGAEQHAFHVDDAELQAALAAAWKRSARKLGLRESLRFGAKPTAPRAPAATRPASLAATLEEIRALLKAGKRADASRAVGKLKVFAAWRHYPKLLLADLSADQRALLETLVDVDFANDLAGSGLFDRDDHLLRYLGRTAAGPSDVTIQVGKRTVPIWWAVSAVGSGHARADEVRAGWQRLPAAKALAAWTEVARDEAYDVLTAHATSMKDSGFSAKPYMIEYRTRIVTLLADVSLAFGAAGARAARALVARLPSWGGGAQVLIALTSALRHAGDAPLDKAYDRTFPRLWERMTGFHAPAIERAIEEALPAPRARAFRAGLTQ
jgi:hypothetical protein